MIVTTTIRIIKGSQRDDFPHSRAYLLISRGGMKVSSQNKEFQRWFLSNISFNTGEKEFSSSYAHHHATIRLEACAKANILKPGLFFLSVSYAIVANFS